MYRDSISEEMCNLINMLQSISDMKQQNDWDAAIETVVRRLECILGLSRKEFHNLTETGFLAQLVTTRPTATIWVAYKQIMLIALLKELGDCAMAKAPPHGGGGWHLKSLHLLLDFLEHEDPSQYPESLPTVELLLDALKREILPIRTRLALMRYYERKGEFGEVRIQFLAALKKRPENRWLLKFGLAFFQRINSESDNYLAAGGLSRSELRFLTRELTVRLG